MGRGSMTLAGCQGRALTKKPIKRHELFICDMPYKTGRPPRQSFYIAPASVDEMKIN